jgi:hypothetical protein
MKKPKSRGGRVMEQKEFEQLHKELLKFDRIGVVSDNMRALIEELWPDLVYKLPAERAA